VQRFGAPITLIVAVLVVALTLSAPALAQQGSLPPPPIVAAKSPESVPDRLTLPLNRAGLKGVVGHWWYMERYGERLLDEYVALGVTNVRLAVDWRQIEETEGELNFDRLDPVMDGFQERGIEVVPVVATVPTWASLNAPDCEQNTLACQMDPEKVPQFEWTMRQLVARYPEVLRWEFWNEPEMWVSMRNPIEYERWYRAFYQAAKETNPNAVVAVSTLTGWDFFRQLSADLPVDAVAVHPYAGDDWGLDTKKILRLREGLQGRGLDVPVWLTEYGWDSRWMDNLRRARTLRWVFNWVLSQPYIELAHYHMLHDIEDDRDCCFGLVGRAPDFVPKQPAYDTFRSVLVEGWVPRPPVRASLAPRE
jgi:hypothetical protein